MTLCWAHDQDGRPVVNLSKYSPEPLDRFARNLVCSIYIKPIIVCINNDHVLTLTYLTERSNFRAKRRNHLTFFDKILYVYFKVRGNENVGHMIRWLPRPYVLKSLKILSFGTRDPISMNFGI